MYELPLGSGRMCCHREQKEKVRSSYVDMLQYLWLTLSVVTPGNHGSRLKMAPASLLSRPQMASMMQEAFSEDSASLTG